MVNRMVCSVFMKAGMVLAGLYANDIKRKPKQVYSNSSQKISVIKNTCFIYIYGSALSLLYRKISAAPLLPNVCSSL